MERDFFEGNVKLISQGIFRATYIIEKYDITIKVKNARHVRCTEYNQSTTTGHLLRETYFEIIAPMDAVKIINGSIPSHLIKRFDDMYYLTKRQYWDGN